MLRRRLDRRVIPFQPEEHRVLRTLREQNVAGRALLVAVSGGIDSVTCLNLLCRLRPVLNFELAVAHIHHGRGSRAAVSYRNRAKKFVVAEAKRLGLPIFTNELKPTRMLKSEAELREFRHAELERLRAEWNPNAMVVFAHHDDDLVETRVLRLIRGTGPEGLHAMTEIRGTALRPLLGLRRAEVVRLAKRLGLNFVEDPSNQTLDPLRNWLRHSWLKALERRSPGAVAAMGRSLAVIAEELQTHKAVRGQEAARVFLNENTMRRAAFAALDRAGQRSAIAKFLLRQGIKNYTLGQINEVLRRLDSPAKSFKFTLLKHEWRVAASRIEVQLKSSV